LGVTGAPETFLVDQQGVIQVHHLGDLNERVWRNKFAPVLAEIDPVFSDTDIIKSEAQDSLQEVSDKTNTAGVGE
jgi:cytochrome c biogenesis protein CcmG/thiol:disulfide interchange protein DsbE